MDEDIRMDCEGDRCMRCDSHALVVNFDGYYRHERLCRQCILKLLCAFDGHPPFTMTVYESTLLCAALQTHLAAFRHAPDITDAMYASAAEEVDLLTKKIKMWEDS